MAANVPRGIAVVDIGATNSKVVLFDAGLQEIARRKTETVHHDGPPYRHIDAQRIVEFAIGAIGELDRVLPVDVIVVSAFGSTLGCVDEAGELATPVMDYLAEPPAEIAEGYAKIAPPFAETFCNTWPAALSLGRQLFWLETAFPEAFARVRSIMTWSQYLAFRLGGRQHVRGHGAGRVLATSRRAERRPFLARSAARLGRSLRAADARLGGHWRTDAGVSPCGVFRPRAHPLRRP